ncbi:MAG: RNA-directed DNA polymerase [Clostridia bacterium]|nr:RNA-directed DNA polymerase [Clostridia bacterium]
MTSEERHERRYQRRKAAREARRREKLAEYDNFDRVADYNSLYAAYKAARSGVAWKASVQRYGVYLPKNLNMVHRALVNGEDVRKGFICFDLVERGKPRHIQSVHFAERVPQKSLCQNALIPVLSDSLIYDNGASRKGMGVSHSISRLERHLHEFYRHYGRDGYVLLIDIRDFFNSIPHEGVKEMIRKKFTDERIISLTEGFIDAFAGDRGLGLGSEICQICAISYPDKVDHYIKEQLRAHWYGRYMDDSYIIGHNKEELKEMLDRIREAYAAMGITLNEQKTRIVKLSRSFTFLKTQFYLTETGKVIKGIGRESVTRERRKLHKFYKLLAAGRMEYDQIRTAYSSWRGYAQGKDAYFTVRRMDALYNDLFIDRWQWNTAEGR